MLFWLLQSLILKLTPTRRLLLLIGIVLSVISTNVVGYSTTNDSSRSNISIVGAGIIIIVLMLELKDKLLARNELEAGRAVQTALTPERSPEIPGWSAWLFSRTANEVGGDLIDFQAINGRQYRLTLADVAGKGLSAALVTAKLQATIRAIASEPLKPEECINRVNRIFFRDKIRNTFASLVYCELDESPVIRIINAGHLPPLILSRGTITEFPKGDAAVGVLPATSFTCIERTLAKNDILLIYSDGLSEARNPNGEFFGTGRIHIILEGLSGADASFIGDRILETVNLFTGDAPVHDDLSLIILKRVV